MGIDEWRLHMGMELKVVGRAPLRWPDQVVATCQG